MLKQSVLSRRWRVPDEPGRQPDRWTEAPLTDVPSIARALIEVLPPRDLARLALRLDQFVTAEDLALLPDDPFQEAANAL